jgi:hypothetical protein
MIHDFENFNKLNEGISNHKSVIVVMLDNTDMKVYSYNTIKEANKDLELLVKFIANATGKEIKGDSFDDGRAGFCYYLEDIDIDDTDFSCRRGYILSCVCDDIEKDFIELNRFVSNKRNMRLLDNIE